MMGMRKYETRGCLGKWLLLKSPKSTLAAIHSSDAMLTDEDVDADVKFDMTFDKYVI
ncbi:hypothetical protein DPMN_167250 [Dreissena polymorpha]|uniref:Uncharacterized protein n=1 Tax=Dreissena polymorpha TaxID=45954 RepID=A0A9D4IUV7_DREPO|nr:hypothetical protein DPMN_167250 [Dreissena polymorpha]